MVFWPIAAGRRIWHLPGNYSPPRRNLQGLARPQSVTRPFGVARNAEPRWRLVPTSPPGNWPSHATSSTAREPLDNLARRRATARRRGRVFMLRKTRIELWFAIQLNHTSNRLPARSRPPSALSAGQDEASISTKVGSSIHRVRPASGFLLVAQSKATRRKDFSYNSGFIPPRRSRLGTNDYTLPVAPVPIRGLFSRPTTRTAGRQSGAMGNPRLAARISWTVTELANANLVGTKQWDASVRPVPVL